MERRSRQCRQAQNIGTDTVVTGNQGCPHLFLLELYALSSWLYPLSASYPRPKCNFPDMGFPISNSQKKSPIRLKFDQMSNSLSILLNSSSLKVAEVILKWHKSWADTLQVVYHNISLISVVRWRLRLFLEK